MPPALPFGGATSSLHGLIDATSNRGVAVFPGDWAEAAASMNTLPTSAKNDKALLIRRE